MREVNPDAFAYPVHGEALDAALRAALPGLLIGVSTYGPARPISVWLDDSARGDPGSPGDPDADPPEPPRAATGDFAAALTAALAHDPVFLSVDKTAIVGNGSDTATITVHTPRPDASPVTLLINGSPVAVSLVSGIGTVELTSADPCTIVVSLDSPANRSADQVSIVAR